jgi:hypothetical protein
MSLQRQSLPRTPRNRHGHGFIDATSVNRAGNVCVPAARANRDRPLFERLAQHLERSARELAELVERREADSEFLLRLSVKQNM